MKKNGLIFYVNVGNNVGNIEPEKVEEYMEKVKKLIGPRWKRG